MEICRYKYCDGECEVKLYQREGGLLYVISKNQIFFTVRVFFTTVSLYIFIYLFDLLALKKTIITFAFLASFTSVLMTTLERLSRSNVRHKLDLLLTLVVIFFCIRYVNRH